MKVLVCGGRDFYHWGLLHNTLSNIKRETPISCIIQGDAKGGNPLPKVVSLRVVDGEFKGVKDDY